MYSKWRYLRLRMTQSSLIKGLKERSDEIYEVIKKVIQEDQAVKVG